MPSRRQSGYLQPRVLRRRKRLSGRISNVSSGGMTTTDTNKTAIAVLGVLLLTMGLGVVSNAIYAPDHAAKPGYDLP